MFDQQLYDQEASELRTRPGDLFHNYEIKNWNFSPRLYKILGISAIFNILLLVGIGSTGLLTARGCDSPFVGRVCQVLDTVYVGTLILGTERDYVNAPYEKTDLGDAEVTFIDVSGVEPPLSYPAGYFQLANPEQQFVNTTDPMAGFNGSTMIPGIPTNPTLGGSGLINTPSITPPNNPNAVDGDLPTGSPLGEANDNPTITNGRRGGGRFRKGSTNQDTGDNVATTDGSNPTVDPTQAISEKDINKRPFLDLAGAVNSMLANKEINLESEFSVAARGKLTKEGKLDKATFRFTKAESSDPKMVNIVKQSIEAFNDSGMLQYLEQLSGKDLNLTIAQDKENISGEVRSEVERETRAKALVSILDSGRKLAIGKKEAKIAQLQAENDPAKAQDLQNTIDELELLKMTEITNDGKHFIVRFVSPKTAIHGLINRKLEAQAKEIKKESGTNQNGLNDNSAKK